MAAEGISGKNGYVVAGSTTLAEITGWRFTPTSNNPAWASSSTGGYKTRVAGVADGSGSFDYVYSKTNLLSAGGITVGASVTLKLYIDTDDYYQVPAIIDSISIDVDMNDGNQVSGSCDFSITAAWTNPV